MSLEEFKPIYFMEWFHRMWGRGLGVLFGVPALAFGLSGLLPPMARPILAGAFTLGALQGGVGWWMVKSGLEERAKDDYKEPRVSPYRLAAHLTMAFSIFSLLTWSSLDLFWAANRTAAMQPKSAVSVKQVVSSMLKLPAGATSIVAAATARSVALRGLAPLSLAAATTIALTSLAGAFVAGNDAGRAYNDWPLYAGKLVPEQIWDEGLGHRNFFENTATVQFDHRNLAYTTVAVVAVLGSAMARRKANLPPQVINAVRAMAVTVTLQAGMGIATLMMYVPVSLGAAHQAGALTLFATALWMRHAAAAAAIEAGAVTTI
jgi:cytochrome c oxidase assembly protein subunit 15